MGFDKNVRRKVRNPKVRESRMRALFVNQDVFWLQIPMHNP
jgi:hypothetical protein